MRITKPTMRLMFTLLLAALACSFPQPGTPPDEEPTLDLEPTPGEEIGTEVVIVPPTPTPVPDPIVVVHRADQFHLYTIGGALLESRSASGMQAWSHPNQVQVVGDAIYYVDSGGDGLGGMVRRSTSAGLEDLAFTSITESAILKFAVAPDDALIAWAAGAWADSHLWAAGIDGSASVLILESAPSLGLEDYYVLETYRWTDVGDLYFAWQISGIGNLLYFGYSSMYRYRPSSGEILPVAEISAGGGMPCWHAVSPDELYLVGVCDADSGVPGLREREWTSATDNLLPLLPNQDQAGAGSYSPSGEKLAYAYARGGMDDVDGYIAVRPSPGDVPVVIASLIDGYFHRIEWADDERLIVGGSQGNADQVYLLLMDGTLSPITDGILVGLMEP